MYKYLFSISIGFLCVSLLQGADLFAEQKSPVERADGDESRCKKMLSCYEMEEGWIVFKRSFYEGVMAIGVSLDTQVEAVHVDATRAMGGLEVGFEYLKPRTFYFGVNLASATGGGSIIGQTIEGPVPTASNLPFFSEIDLRFGYPYVKNRWMITPTLGMGFYAIGCWGSAKGFQSHQLSVNGGVRAFYMHHAYNMVGLCLELLGNVWGEKNYYGIASSYEENFNGCGGRCALPIKWKIGPQQIFDLTLEPFILALNFSNQQLVYGASLTLAAPF